MHYNRMYAAAVIFDMESTTSRYIRNTNLLCRGCKNIAIYDYVKMSSDFIFKFDIY